MDRGHVVILGGGYAGQAAAARLRWQGLPLRVTLIDARNQFVERIRLHQVASGQAISQRSMEQMLAGTGTEFLHGRVTKLNPQQRRLTVETSNGQSQLGYDWLIYALGSTFDTDSVPGVVEHAATLDSIEAAEQLAQALAELAKMGGRLLIVGGGLTGIEAGSEIAEAFKQINVTLLTDGELGAAFSSKGGSHLRRSLQQLGVDIIENKRVVQLQAGRAILRSGGTLSFDRCLWAGGFRAPELAREAGLPVNKSNQVKTTSTLQVPGFPEIFAVGDAADIRTPDGIVLRMACATAMPAGTHAADNIGHLLRGQQVEPIRFAYALRCVSLGRTNGLIQSVRADDAPRDLALSGRTGALIKELVCRYTLLSLAIQRRLKIPYTWPKPGQSWAAADQVTTGD